MNASVTGSALNQIPLVNSTQILTASAQPPMTSVVASSPVVASTPIVSSVQPLAATTPLVSGVQPLAATTPVLAGGVQQLPATSVLGASIPMVQPQPIVASTMPVQPVPQVIPAATTSHIATTSYSSQVVDDDYRLGRGILDDFRPSAYKSQVVGSTLTTSATGLGATNTGLGVTNTGLAVSTPGTVGASNIKDFL